MKRFALFFFSLCISFSVFSQTRLDRGDGNLPQRIENMRGDDSRDSLGNRSNQVQSSNSKGIGRTGLTECAGEFAYCGASTCRPTGRTIVVKEDGGKYTRKYPEATCKCPVITKEIAVQNGASLHGFAALNEGNMNGSCRPPSKGTIWSYAAVDIPLFPQESTSPPFKMAQSNLQTCPAGSGTEVNCWNFLCKIDKKPINGAKMATCFCPIGESPLGHPAPSSDGFLTAAGGYYDNPTKACSMYPVGMTEF